MSDATTEFKPGGGVPDGPLYVDRRDIEPIVTMDEAGAFRELDCDPACHPQDAMVVTYDRAAER